MADSDQCYLCPGNSRAGGVRNAQYDSVFIFVNDYSAVKEDQAAYESPNDKGDIDGMKKDRIP